MIAIKNEGSLPESPIDKKRYYGFDVFKATENSDGKISKLKSVGSAYLTEGCITYTVHLRTFLKDVFYVIPNKKPSLEVDYLILTREPSRNPSRKFFWNNVGKGTLTQGENAGFLHLSWDLLGVDDIYLNLYPKKNTSEV
jgi:hypothetical protein